MVRLGTPAFICFTKILQRPIAHPQNYYTMKKLIFILSCALLSSCAQKFYVNYQSDPTNTGKIELKPSKPTYKTYVTINDSLIIDKKKVKSVTINNVPEGDHQLHYISESGWYKDKLDAQMSVSMQHNKVATKLVEVPPYSTGYWVYSAALVIFTLLLIPAPIYY